MLFASCAEIECPKEHLDLKVGNRPVLHLQVEVLLWNPVEWQCGRLMVGEKGFFLGVENALVDHVRAPLRCKRVRSVFRPDCNNCQCKVWSLVVYRQKTPCTHVTGSRVSHALHCC